MQYEWQGKTMAIRANAILTSSENHILKNLKKKNKMTKKNPTTENYTKASNTRPILSKPETV